MADVTAPPKTELPETAQEWATLLENKAQHQVIDPLHEKSRILWENVCKSIELSDAMKSRKEWTCQKYEAAKQTTTEVIAEAHQRLVSIVPMKSTTEWAFEKVGFAMNSSSEVFAEARQRLTVLASWLSSFLWAVPAEQDKAQDNEGERSGQQ